MHCSKRPSRNPELTRPKARARHIAIAQIFVREQWHYRHSAPKNRRLSPDPRCARAGPFVCWWPRPISKPDFVQGRAQARGRVVRLPITGSRRRPFPRGARLSSHAKAPLARSRRLGRPRALRAALLASSALLLAALPAAAQDATWNNPATVAGPVAGTFDFNAAANWTPAAVPTVTAFFGVSSTHQPVVLGPRHIARSADGPSMPGRRITNSPTAQFSLTSTAPASSSTAAAPPSPTTVTEILRHQHGRQRHHHQQRHVTEFIDTSTAGSATITNNALSEFLRHQHGRQRHHHQQRCRPGILRHQHGRQRHHHQQRRSCILRHQHGRQRHHHQQLATSEFLDSSTAGSATITNNSGMLILRHQHGRQRHHHQQQLLQFGDTSTGGTARFINGAAAPSIYRSSQVPA